MLLALYETAGDATYKEILTQVGLQAYSNITLDETPVLALDFTTIAALSAGLENAFGVRGGRGIALRAGRQFFLHGLKGVGILRGIMTEQFYALPVEAKAEISLLGLATVFSSNSDQMTRLQKQGNQYKLVVDPSPFAWNRVSDTPVCHMMVGAIGASLRWATTDYEFAVYEQSCRACGADQCIFAINKHPIGKV
jgi:predicted hydrocarbon binding protein